VAILNKAEVIKKLKAGKQITGDLVRGYSLESGTVRQDTMVKLLQQGLIERDGSHYAWATRKGGNVNTEFRVKPHGLLPGSQMVEFWRDGVFVAGIYPHEDGIRIVSKYMKYMTRVGSEDVFPPSAVVHLGQSRKRGG